MRIKLLCLNDFVSKFKQYNTLHSTHPLNHPIQQDIATQIDIDFEHDINPPFHRMIANHLHLNPDKYQKLLPPTPVTFHSYVLENIENTRADADWISMAAVSEIFQVEIRLIELNPFEDSFTLRIVNQTQSKHRQQQQNQLMYDCEFRRITLIFVPHSNTGHFKRRKGHYEIVAVE